MCIEKENVSWLYFPLSNIMFSIGYDYLDEKMSFMLLGDAYQ